MNKKGFTLAELLGVIVILGILGLVATSTIGRAIRKGKIDTCKTQEKNIIEGAKMYLIDNPETSEIRIDDLEKGGYIEKDLINPMTGEAYNDNTVVSIKNDEKGKRTYSVKYSLPDKNCE